MLYFLEADTFSLIEIKLLDVQSNDPAEVYFWLRFDKASHTLEKLDFLSMHQDGDGQRREFWQGQLWFNQSSGTYASSEAAEPVTMQAKASSELPAKLDEAIHHYFVGT